MTQEMNWGFASDQQWFTTFKRRLNLYSNRYGVDRDDMVQQASISLARRGDWRSMKPEVAAWKLRSVYRPIAHDEREAALPDDAGIPVTDEYPSIDPYPQLRALNHQNERIARMKIAGFTNDETASAMGVSERTVRNRLKKIQEQLA